MTSVKIPARCKQILGYEDVAWLCLEQQKGIERSFFFFRPCILRCAPMDLTALIIQCFRDVRYHWCGPLFRYLLWTCLSVCCIPRFLVRNGTAQQEVHARTPSSKAFVSRHFVEASCWIHMRAWSRFCVRMLCSANEICDAFTMLSTIGVWTDLGRWLTILVSTSPWRSLTRFLQYRCLWVHCCIPSLTDGRLASISPYYKQRFKRRSKRIPHGSVV